MGTAIVMRLGRAFVACVVLAYLAACSRDEAAGGAPKTQGTPSRVLPADHGTHGEMRLGSVRAALVTTTSIDASGDAYLRSGSPNQNAGGDTLLSVQASGDRRVLLFFDNAAITAAVGTGTLVSARLDLSIFSTGTNWGTGRPIAVHRLARASAEYQATWNCALDANVNNQQADCSGPATWDMGASNPAEQPWSSPETATAMITNAQTGVVSFDVTADVSALLAGTWPGHGWLVKKVDETQNGSIEFASRERAPAPRLFLEIDGGSSGGGPDPIVGSAALPVQKDTHLRQGQPNQNFGSLDFLRIQASGRNRALIGVDAAAVGTALQGELVRARLLLPIAQTYDNWGPDRTLGAHRMRRGWSELAATWNCATDTDVSNGAADCTGDDAWLMWGPGESVPWLDPPTDTELISSGQTGTLEFDVTRDVACALAGHVAMEGWLIKKGIESQSGKIELRARETATAPSLLLEWTDGSGVSVTQEMCTGVPSGEGCTPTASQDTTCNGLDEDCDGTADDDFTVEATACGVGVCSATGETSCVGGQVVDSCTPSAPASNDATCNGLDEDCDGALDEDYVHVPTSCGVGSCAATGTTSCSQGQIFDSCAPGTPAGSDATCNGLDEDCDGTADEDFVPAPTTCMVGACAASGVTECVNGAPGCSPGELLPIPDDGNPCTADVCDPQVGSSHPPRPEGTLCADADACNGIETCNAAGACVAGAPPAVDDGNPCTTDSCDASSGVQHVPLPEGTSCDDADVCNGAETCSALGTCQGDAPLVVDDGSACTTDSCDPVTGVSHVHIAGCDAAPIVAGAPFETRASVLGKLVTGTGAAVTDYEIEVYDVPVTDTPRDDVLVTAESDGSFRVRLAEFPESMSEHVPSHHLMVRIEGAAFVPMLRDVYVRSGDAIDLGRLYVLARDPAVTLIGPAGGVASDSLGRVEVTFPPGAVGSQIPVRITPVPERRSFPYPLPEATSTMYGVILEPSQTFASPVTVRIDNYLDVPTSLQIPVGIVDEENGGWEHETFATWDGSAFRFQLDHFSTVDANAPFTGTLYIFETGGANAQGNQTRNCAGSSVAYGSGALRQSVSLPTYTRQGKEYGLTLEYDSSLAGSHRLGHSPTSTNGATQKTGADGSNGGGAGNGLSIDLPISAPAFFFACIGSGGSGAGGCNTGSSCFGAAAPPSPFLLRGSIAGSEFESAGDLAGGENGISSSHWVPLPLNEDDSVPPPAYFPFERQLTLGAPVGINVSGGGGNCTGGGSAFGVQASVQTPMPTDLEPGSVAIEKGYELLYHRRSSVIGTGWGIGNVREAFKAPNDAQIDIVHGDGTKESFRPRIEPDIVLNPPGTSVILDHDAQTGDVYFFSSGVHQLHDDGLSTPVTPSVSLSNARDMATTLVDAEPRFFLATNSALHEITAAGQTAQLATWPIQPSTNMFRRPHVAAAPNAVYFTDGSTNRIQRIRLDDTLRTVEFIGMESGGDIRVNPRVPAGQVSFDAPRGLAVGLDGSLYVACFQRHMVYRLLPQEDGLIGPESEVERVLGNGMGTYGAVRGGLDEGVHFSMNQPLHLDISDDGYLFVMNSEGLASYDPISKRARWFANDRRDGLTFQIDANPSFVALDRDQALIDNSSVLITLTLEGFASEFEPTRRVTQTPAGLEVVDTSDDVIETYEWSDGSRIKARLVSRVARTGEALLHVGYEPGSDRVAWLQDPSGGRFTLDYDGAGRLRSIQDAAGSITFIDVDADNNLREIQLPTGETRRFEYDGHRMTVAEDPRGEPTAYDFRNNGTVERVTRPGGAAREFAPAFQESKYSGNQLVREGTYTDDRGVTHTIRVDEAGQVIMDAFVADGVSYDVRSVYSGNLTGTGLGGRTNKIRRIASTTINGLQVTPTVVWDAQGRPMDIVNPAGSGITTPGSRVAINYDESGRVALLNPGETNVSFDFQYDANGRVSSIVDMLSTTPRVRRTDFTWRSDGQPSTITEHTIPTTFTYHPTTGNLQSVSNVTGSMSFQHDVAGNVTLESDGQMSVAYGYDDSNRLLTITDALGNQTVLGYGHAGCGCARDNLITSIVTPDLPAGQSWSLGYDADGRLTSVTDPDGFTEHYGYTPSGDLQTFTDRLQHSTFLTYDQLGRPLTTVDPAGRMGIYAYPVPTSTGWVGPAIYAGSPNGTPAPTSLTDVLQAGQYQVGLNAFRAGGAPPQIELYRDATFALSYAHSFDNQLRPRVRRDRSHLPFASASPFGTQTPGAESPFMHALYGYDSNSPAPHLDAYESHYLSLEGRFEFGEFSYNDWFDIVGMEGWGGTSHFAATETSHTFGRDSAGRVVSESQSFSARTAGPSSAAYTPPSRTYDYDDATGYLTHINNGSGIQDITYDARGLIDTVTLSFQPKGTSSTTTEGVFSYDYDELGRNTYLQFPDGHVRRQEFDAHGRVTSRCYEYGGGDTRCYTAQYDPVGNPIVLGDPEGTSHIDYDDLDRVIEVRREMPGQPDEVEGYAYNALGALSTHQGESVDHQRPRLDNLGTAPAGIPASHDGDTVTLDAGGHITALLGATLTHTKQTRLRDIVEGTTTHKFGFDALQRRIGYQKTGQTTEVYLHEGDDIVAVINGSGLAGIQRRILYDAIDHPLWMYDAAEDITLYFELDTIGNVRRLRGGRTLDPDGTPPPADLGGYRYTAFGRLQPPDAGTPYPALDGAPFEQPIRWQGRWYVDAAGGVYDFRARTWSPEIGAFLQLDEYSYLTRTGTLWSWPGQNPFRWRDPTGRGSITNRSSQVIWVKDEHEVALWPLSPGDTYAAADGFYSGDVPFVDAHENAYRKIGDFTDVVINDALFGGLRWEYSGPLSGIAEVAQTLVFDLLSRDGPGWQPASLLDSWGWPTGGVSEPGECRAQ